MKKLLALKLNIIIKTGSTVPFEQTDFGIDFRSDFLEQVLILLSKSYFHY